jgi:hypothetical protein
MNTAFQLILLPGLGTDHRLLESQRREFPQLVVPAWIPPRTNESLPDYAARMAETVKPLLENSPLPQAGEGPGVRAATADSSAICPHPNPLPKGEGTNSSATSTPLRTRPLLLGGVSFGGMLAYEMASHLKPDAVVLIASCRTRQSLRPMHRAASRLLPLIPVQAWDLAKLLAGPVVRLRTRVPAAQRHMAVTMFRQSDSRFMHWVLQAILSWQPSRLEGVRVCQIHGRRDLLIPARRVEADELIPDGGHLINITHAAQVNAFIRSTII